MTEQILNTAFGKFRLTISEDYVIDYMTREQTLLGHMVHLGGKNKCVQINVPLRGDVARMLNMKGKDGGCEINDNEIRGPKMVNLVLLAFTVVTQKWPHIKFITLEDKSNFTCKLSNGLDYSISLTIYELALHRKTWYELHFGAYLVNETLRRLYEPLKQNFDKPHPTNYDFKNKILNDVLTPIFANTVTWSDFLNVLKKMENRCELMSLWYKSTVANILDNISFDGQEWKIDLSNPLIHPIDYTVVKGGGSRRRTRKNKYKGRGGSLLDIEPNEPVFGNNNMFYEEMYNMDFPALRRMVYDS
jgi:hypothetical protein